MGVGGIDSWGSRVDEQDCLHARNSRKFSFFITFPATRFPSQAKREKVPVNFQVQEKEISSKPEEPRVVVTSLSSSKSKAQSVDSKANEVTAAFLLRSPSQPKTEPKGTPLGEMDLPTQPMSPFEKLDSNQLSRRAKGEAIKTKTTTIQEPQKLQKDQKIKESKPLNVNSSTSSKTLKRSNHSRVSKNATSSPKDDSNS